MAEKKMPGRFTIQFNLEDPQQRMAAELLEQQGRRKAQFLASAVLQYIQAEGAPGGRSMIDTGLVKRIMLELLKNDPDFYSLGVWANDMTVPVGQEQVPEQWGSLNNSQAVAAISSTLAAFQQR